MGGVRIMKRLQLLAFKILIVGTIIFSCSSAFALSLSWNHNTETDLAWYKVYRSATPDGQTIKDGSHIYQIPAGTNSINIDDTPEGLWYWIATAGDTSNNESNKSNEVSYRVDRTPPADMTVLEITP